MIGKAMTCTLETQETMPNEPQCFPSWTNNSKHNKNIININGIFIVGLLYSFMWGGLAFFFRFGVITISQGSLYFFFFFCCVPILLPTIYFVRNPKHFILVLQDHNLMPNAGMLTLASRIDVGQWVNIGPGTFGKKNKCSALNTHV